MSDCKHDWLDVRMSDCIYEWLEGGEAGRTQKQVTHGKVTPGS